MRPNLRWLLLFGAQVVVLTAFLFCSVGAFGLFAFVSCPCTGSRMVVIEPDPTPPPAPAPEGETLND